MNETDDPGWRGAWRGLAFLRVYLLPFSRGGGNPSGGDPLVVIRTLFVSFVTFLVVLGILVPFFAPSNVDVSRTLEAVVFAGLVLLGVAGVSTVRFFRATLECSSDGALASSYRTRLFLRIAFAESIALVGFVVTFQGVVWAYYLAAAFSVVGFWILAPTARNLARDQDRLTSSGCTRDLVRAIRNPQDG